MTASTRLEAAKRLTDTGYRIIPVGQNKTPAISTWKPYQEPEAVVSDTTLAGWFADESAVRGFGILGGRASGNLCVIDFDTPESLPGDTASRTYQAWRQSVDDDELLSRLAVIATPSGGLHVYVRCESEVPGNQKLAYASTANGYRILVETRGEGGYVVGPGSHANCHPTGREYVQHEGRRPESVGTVSVAELESLLSAARSFDQKPAPEPIRAQQWQDGPAEEGRPGDDFNNRTTWAEILQPRGFELIRTDERGLSYWRRPGSANKQSLTTGIRENGRDLAYAFSPNCGVPVDVGLTRFTFVAEADYAGDFRQASRELRDQGYGKRDDFNDVDLSNLIADRADNAIAFDVPEVMADPGPLPAELRDVPGFIGTFVRYAKSCGPKPQPELAIGNALVMLGALVGRKVILPPDGRCNVFAIALGSSGSGKKAAITAAKNIAAEAMLRQTVPGRGVIESGLPKSDAGVMKSLYEEPSTAWLIDECGDFLDAVGSPKAPAHLKQIVRVLVDLYSSSGDRMYSGGAYADSNNRLSVACPNLNLYGASTTRRFVEALSESLRDGGFVGRLLVFRADENAKPQKGRTIDREAEKWLADFATEWTTWQPHQLFDTNPEPREAIVTDDATERLEAWHEACESRSRERDDDVWRSVWGRAVEKAGKLALIHAASQVVRPDKTTVRVDDESAAWGVAVSDHSVRSLLFLLDRYASDSKAESILKAVRRVIDGFPSGVVPKNKLTRKLQKFSHSERESAISTLLDSEELFRHHEATEGRPKVTYYRPDAYREAVERAKSTAG